DFPRPRKNITPSIFTYDSVHEYIKNNYRDDKASGPDGIRGKIFTLCTEEIIPYLVQFGS
ncbi:NELlike 1 (Silurana), partial [Caligus rogercresseyi]